MTKSPFQAAYSAPTPLCPRGFFLQGPPSDAAAQEHRAARLAAVRTHDPRFVDTPHGAGACGGCWRAGDSATKCRPKGGGSFNHGPVETTDAAGRVKGGADFDSTLLGKHVTVVRVVNDPTEFGGVVTAFDHATGAHTVDTAAGVRTHYLAYFPRTRMTIAEPAAAPAVHPRNGPLPPDGLDEPDEVPPGFEVEPKAEVEPPPKKPKRGRGGASGGGAKAGSKADKPPPPKAPAAAAGRKSARRGAGGRDLGTDKVGSTPAGSLQGGKAAKGKRGAASAPPKPPARAVPQRAAAHSAKDASPEAPAAKRARKTAK